MKNVQFDQTQRGKNALRHSIHFLTPKIEANYAFAYLKTLKINEFDNAVKSSYNYPREMNDFKNIGVGMYRMEKIMAKIHAENSRVFGSSFKFAMVSIGASESLDETHEAMRKIHNADATIVHCYRIINTNQVVNKWSIKVYKTDSRNDELFDNLSRDLIFTEREPKIRDGDTIKQKGGGLSALDFFAGLNKLTSWI